jgi:hypothetical protein
MTTAPKLDPRVDSIIKAAVRAALTAALGWEESMAEPYIDPVCASVVDTLAKAGYSIKKDSPPPKTGK